MTVTDSAGTPWQAGIFYASPTQISFAIPSGVVTGSATIAVTTDSSTFTDVIIVTATGPGVFAANANGAGPLAAQVVTVLPSGAQTYTDTAGLNGKAFVNDPIGLTSTGDSFYLLLYATGIRHGSSVTVTINGVTYTPTYSGAQGYFDGLDQINLLLPASLVGAGPVAVGITVDGQLSNAGTISFQ